MAADDAPSIIGRERALIGKLAGLVHGTVRKHHHYGPVHETRRGAYFDVELLVGDEPTGRDARVTVELLPPRRDEAGDA